MDGSFRRSLSRGRAWAAARRPPRWLRADSTFVRAARTEALRALPFGLVLALGLGLGVVVGAHLSHALPSDSRPFGWPGAASFENAVAMDRSKLVLATTVPALFLGTLAARRAAGSPASSAIVLGALGADVVVISASVFVAGGIGSLGASKTPGGAYVAFCVAHTLLALAVFAIAHVASMLHRRAGAAGAVGLWIVFFALYESTVRWRLFREIGDPGIDARAFPEWFYLAQVFSPAAAYRGLLILWRPGFRNYEERAALDGATLPPWVGPEPFAAALVLWIAFPLAVSVGVWAWRSHRAAARAARRSEGTEGVVRVPDWIA